MKYSFVFVLYLGALVIQCSCRPQAEVSAESPSTTTEAAMTDASEPLVFDEEMTNGQDGDNENAGGTTEMPASEMQDGQTTMTPCDGGECNPMDMDNAEASTEPSMDDGENTTTGNDTGETTTQTPESSL